MLKMFINTINLVYMSYLVYYIFYVDFMGTMMLIAIGLESMVLLLWVLEFLLVSMFKSLKLILKLFVFWWVVTFSFISYNYLHWCLMNIPLYMAPLLMLLEKVFMIVFISLNSD